MAALSQTRRNVTLLVALLFGFFVARTGSILGVTLSHGLTNIMLFLVIPFVVVDIDGSTRGTIATDRVQDQCGPL